jgi:hypothetical protein
MKTEKACAHLACSCNARRGSRYCSPECERDAAHAGSTCACGHEACAEAESGERASEFARTHDASRKS